MRKLQKIQTYKTHWQKSSWHTGYNPSVSTCGPTFDPQHWHLRMWQPSHPGRDAWLKFQCGIVENSFSTICAKIDNGSRRINPSQTLTREGSSFTANREPNGEAWKDKSLYVSESKKVRIRMRSKMVLIPKARSHFEQLARWSKDSDHAPCFTAWFVPAQKGHH